MMKYISIILFFFILLLPDMVNAEREPVGNIKTLSGDVTVFRGEQKLTAVIGMTVFQKDVIQTSMSGTVGIIFNDDSIMSLGPDSRLDMTEYVFKPKEDKFSLLMKMLKGTFVYISGAIGRLSPDSVKLETPSSIIGTRGTKVLIEVKG